MVDEAQRLDIVLLLARRWLTIAIFAVLGAGAGIAYGLTAPSWYLARLTVIPSADHASPNNILASLPGAEALGATGGADVQRIQAVLTSNSVTDEVITKFKLLERYHLGHLEQARHELWQHCAIDVDRKSNVVALECEDKDPHLAQDMTAFFGDVGNRVFGRISNSSAHEERQFLEAQVVKARKDVDDASVKLREFQERYRIVDIGEQSKAVISAMASIEGELVSKQLELTYLSGFSSRTEASVVQLQQQIDGLRAKLKQLEQSAAGSDDPKFFPDAMRFPELRYQLEQLFRDQKIAETVFFLMTQRYETAKIDEARDTSTFQVLDSPTLPTFRTRPQRRRAAMLGLAGGLGVALAWILVPAWIRQRRRAGQADVTSAR